MSLVAVFRRYPSYLVSRYFNYEDINYESLNRLNLRENLELVLSQEIWISLLNRWDYTEREALNRLMLKFFSLTEIAIRSIKFDDLENFIITDENGELL